MKTQNKNIRKKFIGMLALMCSAIVLFGASGCTDANAYKAIEEAASQVNKTCPMQVDAVTTVQSVEARKPRTMHYNMIVKLTDQVTEDAVKTNMKPITVSQVKSNPATLIMRNMDVTFSYSYKTPEGKTIVEFSVTPEDYK